MKQEWKDMQEIWEQTNPAGAGVDEIVDYVIERAKKFDRRIRWEHRLGWVGMIVGLACVVDLMTIVESPVEVAFALSMAAFLIGITAHMWLVGRSKEPVDRSLSRTEFRSTLEKKFRTQIRLLGATKFWFVLPLVVTGAATAWAYLSGNAAEKDWMFFAIILAGSALASWFNEFCSVRGLRRDWQKVRRALDDGELG